MYVRHEAVLSSQIEGTQSTLDDVLVFEAEGSGAGLPKDIDEVVNYIAAMNFGLERLQTLPLSLRLLREIHAELMKGVRGQEKQPGEFRKNQNWLGAGGSPISHAEFGPPPPQELGRVLGELEEFLHDQTLPPLIHVALCHAQFETIHPFLDGNGRVGRLLITLLLCERRILSQPLLYLSIYLKAHRAQYYDRLTATRTDGDWEGWVRFFVTGVRDVSASAAATAHQIIRLRESLRDKPGSSNGKRLIEVLFRYPVLNVTSASQLLKCSFATANKVIEELVELGTLREMTGNKRNRTFRFDPYLKLFDLIPLVQQAGAGPSIRTQPEDSTEDVMA